MPRRNISSGSPYEESIGFSRAVRRSGRIVVSGTGPIGADGKTVAPDDAYAQARRCLEIIERAIIDAGGSLDDVVRTRMYLTDIGKWKEVGKAHGEFFAQIRPASTMVEVKGLVGPDWYVEIEADCILEKG